MATGTNGEAGEGHDGPYIIDILFRIVSRPVSSPNRCRYTYLESLMFENRAFLLAWKREAIKIAQLSGSFNLPKWQSSMIGAILRIRAKKLH